MSDLTSAPRTGFLNMPRLPVAGFFSRLLAFVLDFLLIIAALHIASKTIPDFFWSLGAASGYATSAFCFLYFAAFNGPFGKGRTIGKMVLGIATTDYHGDPPSWRQSIMRTVILIPLFVLVPLSETLFGPGGDANTRFWKTAMTVFPMIAMILTTALIIPFNPFKQGLHDFLSKTLVRPTKGEAALNTPTFDDLITMVGSSWPTFHRQPQYSGLVSLALVVVVLSIMAWPGQRTEEQKNYLNAMYALDRLPGFDRSAIEGPIPLRIYEAQQNNDLGAAEEARKIEEAETTGTLRLVLEASRPGGWEFDTLREAQRGEILMDEWYAIAFPAMMDYMAAQGGKEDAEDDNAAKNRFQQLSQQWKRRDIELHLKFVKKVYLTPHGLALRETVGSYTKNYSPLEPE